MAIPYYTSINLNKNELQNARIQNLASSPASPVAGLVYFDTTLNKFGLYNGTTWVYAATTADLASYVTTATTINGHALSGNITITNTDVGLGNVTNDAQVKRTEMGVASGVATLDVTGHVPTSQLPAAIVGALQYQGVWNATTNTPTLASGTGTKGFFYKVSVAGSTVIDTISQWNIGDMIMFDGTTWDKIDGEASEVISVSGRTGTIVLTTADVASSTNARYLTDAQLVVVGNTSNTNTGDETGATIKTKLGITTLSGSNTGDQTITLTGDVTGSGTGSFATTIAAGSVTLAKQANLAANSIIGNNTGSAATPLALTTTQVKSLLAITEADVANLTTDLSGKVAITVTVNGHALSSNVVVSASDLTTGTLPHAQLPALLSGDIPNNAANTSGTAALATALAGGLTNQISYQTAAGVSGFIATINSGVLVTNGSGVPSISTTLPSVNGSALTGLTGTQISGNISGNAANITGTIAIANGGTGATTAAAARTALGAVTKYVTSVGNGTLTSFTVTHNLGTEDINISVYDTVSLMDVYCDVTRVDSNNVTIATGTFVPATNQLRIVIIG